MNSPRLASSTISLEASAVVAASVKLWKPRLANCFSSLDSFRILIAGLFSAMKSRDSRLMALSMSLIFARCSSLKIWYRSKHSSGFCRIRSSSSKMSSHKSKLLPIYSMNRFMASYNSRTSGVNSSISNRGSVYSCPPIFEWEYRSKVWSSACAARLAALFCDAN